MATKRSHSGSDDDEDLKGKWYESIPDMEDFLCWFSSNIGYEIITEVFNDEYLNKGGKNHILKRFEDIEDKLEFWLYLDKEKKKRLVKRYLDETKAERKKQKREKEIASLEQQSDESNEEPSNWLRAPGESSKVDAFWDALVESIKAPCETK